MSHTAALLESIVKIDLCSLNGHSLGTKWISFQILRIPLANNKLFYTDDQGYNVSGKLYSNCDPKSSKNS